MTMTEPDRTRASGHEDFDEGRMRRERLSRAQAGLRAQGLGAALLFDPNNVRYTTSIGVAVVENLHVPSRWALVPAEGEPVLWEYEDALHLAETRFGGDIRPAHGWTFFGSGSNSARDAASFADEIDDALRERGLAGERLGVDRVSAVAFLALQSRGIVIADAQPAIEEARAVKTEDEQRILRRNAAICDRAVEAMRAAIEPGVTENHLWGGFLGQALGDGAEYSETRLLASGPRTNPWMQEASDRVVQQGDLVGLDTDLIGRDGYLTDYSRTYLCGDARPTDEQRRLYTVAYEFVHAAIPEFVPGASFRELGERLGPRLGDEFQQQRYPFVAHGSGLADEWPAVVFEGHHDGEVQVGMSISVEAYVGAVGGRDGVKFEEQIIITEDGAEIISGASHEQRLLA
jgi:Xaa-Pro aminopeptidase